MPGRKKSNLSRCTRNAKRMRFFRSQELEEDRKVRLNANRASHIRSLASETSTLHSEAFITMDVIELDSDDIADNNENQNVIVDNGTQKHKVNSPSVSTHQLTNNIASEVNTEDKQAIQMSKTSSSQDLDKFKRRLIRVIARSLVIEKKPEAQFWEELQKVTSCDCRLLWTRMRTVTIKKLRRLLIVEDKAQYITKIARLSVTDWLLIDLVLVHEKVDVIGQEEQEGCTNKREPKILEYLFKLVLNHNVEQLSGDKLTEAWINVANDYNKRGRFCSPMLLQRRWFQMKELVWYNFYNFWYSYRGDSRNLDSAGRFKPTKLQTEIIQRFSKIATEQFLTWEELIKQKKVVLLEDFERYELEQKKGNGEAGNEPDLVVIEPHVETIDLGVESDSDSKDEDRYHVSDANEAGVTTDKLKINLSIVKNESLDELSDEDDISILEDVNIPLDTLKPLNAILDKDIDEGVVTNKNVSNISDTNVTSYSGEVICDSDEAGTDNEDDDVVILNDSKDKAKSNDSLIEARKYDVTETDLNKSNEQSISFVKTMDKTHDDSKMTTQKINMSGATVESKGNIKHEGDNDQVSKFEKNTADSTEDKVLPTNVTIDLDSETSLPSSDVDSKQNLNILYDVTSNLGVYMDGLELEDDGIEYIEEDEEEDIAEIHDEIENKEDYNKNQPKIDLKLLLQTVVYTKKLEDMDVFRFIDYKSVKDARIIEHALLESLPEDKKTFKTEDISKSHKTDKTETDDNVTSEDDNSDDFQERISYKSWYFRKPKVSKYNPIQLCKNPDFNTRLKRLTAGFFSSERNRRLLKECKPLTIDIYKSFEMKLQNNSLLLSEFPQQTIKTETITPTDKPLDPIVLPCDNVTDSIENILDTSNQYSSNICDLPNVCEKPSVSELPKDLPSNINDVEPQIVERNKVINLLDIDQIRRANERLLIAEVTPIQVCATNSKPPVEILQHTVNTQNINAHICQNKKISNIVNSDTSLLMKNNICNADNLQSEIKRKGNEKNNTVKSQSKERAESTIEISKRILKKVSGKPPPTNYVREFVQKGIPTDRFLALDTVERILSICNDNVDSLKCIKKKNKKPTGKPKVLAKGKKPTTNNAEIGTIQVVPIGNNKFSYSKEIPANQETCNEQIPNQKSIDNKASVAGKSDASTSTKNTEKKEKWRKKNRRINIYCCWAREKLLSMTKFYPFSRRPHTCHVSACTCCCRDEYMKTLSLVHPMDSINQVLDSDKREYNDPLKYRIFERTSRGVNTDDDPAYSLSLLEASKTPSIVKANNDLLGPQFAQRDHDVSSEISTYSKTVALPQQTQTMDVSINVVRNNICELNPIITTVQSLSQTLVVPQDDDQINDNIVKSPLQVKCKTNVHYNVSPRYLKSCNEQNKSIPEPPTQVAVKISDNKGSHISQDMHKIANLTVVFPDDHCAYISKKMQKTSNPISLGKNKILLCSTKPKDQIGSQINEQIIPPKVLVLEKALEAVQCGSLALGPNNQLTLTIDPKFNLNSSQINNMLTVTSFVEQQKPKDTLNVCDNTSPAYQLDTPSDANYTFNVNVSNQKPNSDSCKANDESRDVRNDEKTENSAISSNSSLVQGKSGVDIDTQCKENIEDSPTCDQNVSNNKIILLSESQNMQDNKFNQNETIIHKSVDGTTKKTILSDLMQMSGISIEDTTVNNESTGFTGDVVVESNACENNTTEKEVSENIFNSVSHNPENIHAEELNDAISDQLNSIKLDLNVISSFFELKQAYNKNKQFYKMDIGSGKIIPINVVIKKHTTQKPKPILIDTVIDLTDDGETEKESACNAPTDELKQVEIIKPIKLFKAVHPRILKASTSILKKQSTCDLDVSQTKSETLMHILNRKRKEQTRSRKSKMTITKDDDNVKVTTITSDSDDEPLALKVKRKKNDGDSDNEPEKKTQDENMTEISETVEASTNKDTNVDKPDQQIGSPKRVLEPVVFNDSSDEDCILGV